MIVNDTEDIVLLAVALCFRPVNVDKFGKQFVCFSVAEGILHEGEHILQRLFIEYLQVFFENLHGDFLPNKESGRRFVDGIANVLRSCCTGCSANNPEQTPSSLDESEDRRVTALHCLKFLSSLATVQRNCDMLNHSTLLTETIYILAYDPNVDPITFQELLQYIATNRSILHRTEESLPHLRILDVILSAGELVVGEQPSSFFYPEFLRSLHDIPTDPSILISRLVEIMDIFSSCSENEFRCSACLKRFADVAFTLLVSKCIDMKCKKILCHICVTNLRRFQALGMVDEINVPVRVFETAWNLCAIRNLQAVSSQLVAEISSFRKLRKDSGTSGSQCSSSFSASS